MTLKEKDAFIITRDDNSLMELVLSEEGLFTVTSQRVYNGKMLQKTLIIECRTIKKELHQERIEWS